MTPPTTAIRRALYGKLSGDGTLTNALGTAAPGYTRAIYYSVIPENAGFPCVVFSEQSALEYSGLKTFGTIGEHRDDVWLVKAVDRNTTADRAEALADRAKILLNNSIGTANVSGGTILYLHRESDLPDYSEVVDGEIYYHCGSRYRLDGDFGP